MKKNYIETGKIVGTHGIKGELRVQPWCDSPEFLTDKKRLYLDENGTQIAVDSARVHGNLVLLKLHGVDSIESAEKLRGIIIYVHRDDIKLDNKRYLIADLIGCEVFDADSSEQYGVLSEVSQTGANDVWHITKDGAEYLVPAINEVVDSVDVDRNRVQIRPMKGIFDDEN